MPFELLVAVNVTDEVGYRNYRYGMLPILEKYGGGFRYDFRVSEVLASENGAPMNRVFAIYFADEAAKEAFFSNEAYLAVKKAHFEHAVSHTTVIAAYER